MRCGTARQRPMETQGQGILYQHFGGYDRGVLTTRESAFLYHQRKHHLDAVRSLLTPDSLLIDCHSFPSDLYDCDICIGHNSDETYEEKGNGVEMPVKSDASDNLVVTGKHFQYRNPFGEIERADSLFSDNVKYMMEVARIKWNGTENEESILNHTINGVGVSPYLWRQAVIEGFYDD